MAENQTINKGVSASDGYEKHDVNIPIIVGFALVCIITVVICVCALDGYFVYSKEKLKSEMSKVEPRALNQLKAEQKEILSNYAIVDKKKGIYRIPISRAMQLISEEALVKENADKD